MSVVRCGGNRGRRERPRAPLSQARQADAPAARGCHASASRGLSRSGTITALWCLSTSSQLLRTPYRRSSQNSILLRGSVNKARRRAGVLAAPDPLLNLGLL
jgi:hypothetical protein